MERIQRVISSSGRAAVGDLRAGAPGRPDLPWRQALSDLPDVSVALGGVPASLAVATPTRLAVWDLAAGKIIVQRGDASP